VIEGFNGTIFAYGQTGEEAEEEEEEEIKEE